MTQENWVNKERSFEMSCKELWGTPIEVAMSVGISKDIADQLYMEAYTPVMPCEKGFRGMADEVYFLRVYGKAYMVMPTDGNLWDADAYAERLEERAINYRLRNRRWSATVIERLPEGELRVERCVTSRNFKRLTRRFDRWVDKHDASVNAEYTAAQKRWRLEDLATRLDRVYPCRTEPADVSQLWARHEFALLAGGAK
jgi:hypothetical protein